MSDLSPWESEILRFPGHVPGVPQRCSPVLGDGDRSGAIITLWASDSMATVGWMAPHDQGDDWLWPLSRLALDLQNATGRAHLAWWLQLEHGSGGGSIEDGGFRIDWQPGRWAWARPGVENTGREWFLCPPLQFGAKDDGRSLPDGSSLLRALALGIIARHVTGLPIPVRP